jgi:integrase
LIVKIRLADGSGTIDLKYLYEDVDRHGKVRVYFRRKGQRKINLRAPFGTEEFLEQYRQAYAGQLTTIASKSDAPRNAPGSLRSLIEQYYHSAEFRGLDERTQYVRRLILDGLCAEPLNAEDPNTQTTGAARFSLMEPKHVRKIRDRKSKTPEAANSRVKALRQVFKWAIDAGHSKVNPAKDVPYLNSGSQGFHAWTTEEVQRFATRHPIGTKPGLAFALLLLTGQRRSDVVLFGKQHVRDPRSVAKNLRDIHPGNWLHFTQQKNRNRKPVTLMIPLLLELEEIIAASPCGDLTFLVTAFGKPFTSAGFGNWFRERCDEAGLPNCTAHGLRKAGATIAAENGASERQLMAIFGWQTSKQAVLYTRAAEQKVLAGGAMALLSINRK